MAPDSQDLAPTPEPEERAPKRPEARVLAFESLYEHDIARHAAGQVLERLAEEQWADAESLEGARALVTGVLAKRAELDRVIAELAPAWPLVQMSAIDRNILRLGLFELRFSESGARQRAAISAAVDLAKVYGGESSPRFVRAVLGRAAARDVSATPGDPNPTHPSTNAP